VYDNTPHNINCKLSTHYKLLTTKNYRASGSAGETFLGFTVPAYI